MDNLLENWKEPCELLNQIRTPDGEGGFYNTWEVAGDFRAAVRLDSSTQAKIAEAQGVKNLYTIITDKDVKLEYHDVFRRKSSGETLRVTSESADNQTPDSSTIQVRMVSAEKWSLVT
jgi:hypothetical protein